MLFHTWTFFCFFAVALIGLLLLRKTPFWVHWILGSSYFFYGWWNYYYLALIIYSTGLDFFTVRQMERPGARKKLWLWISILNNLSLLGFFKYADFFISNINDLTGLNISPASEIMPFGLEYLLPVGISFYTFQSMSYTIDYYRGKIKRETSFIRFAAFVSFFPQLVAGPIERAKSLLPQFQKFPKIKRHDIAAGASLFIVGLFKKLALANYAALYVDRIYEDPASANGASLALATFAFAWQIYFDFSAYTDMARGTARIMGFKLSLNFKNPYTSASLSEFWSRWHISLSTWFRDYVYFPLGGNKKGIKRTYINLLSVFIISGLWHGAAWTFLAWGLLHGVGLTTEKALTNVKFGKISLPRWVKIGATFLLVCAGWIFFRSESIDQALLVYRKIFSLEWEDPQFPLFLLLMIGCVWIYQLMFESKLKKILKENWIRVPLLLGMIIYLFFCSSEGDQFIYFQF